MISSVDSNAPSSIPPLIIRSSWSFAKFVRAFAILTGSPLEPSGRVPVNAIAVGPTSNSSISRFNSFAATRTRVFLYTLYSPPACFIAVLKTAISVTSSPRYSVRMTASALENFSCTSATIAIFSGLGSPMGDPFYQYSKKNWSAPQANTPLVCSPRSAYFIKH